MCELLSPLSHAKVHPYLSPEWWFAHAHMHICQMVVTDEIVGGGHVVP